MRFRFAYAIVVTATLAVVACKKSSSTSRQGAAPTVAPLDAAAQNAAAADSQFWRWFEANAARLRAVSDFVTVMNEIQAELDKEHAGVIAELTEDDKDRVLVLSADGDKKLFPTVQRLYAARPNVAGWSVIAFRPPADPKDPTTKMEMNGKSIDPAKVRFVVVSTGDPIDIDVYVPGYIKDDETMGMLGFLALDHTVGEYAMETRIGGIEWHPIEQAPASARPLVELLSVVAAK